MTLASARFVNFNPFRGVYILNDILELKRRPSQKSLRPLPPACSAQPPPGRRFHNRGIAAVTASTSTSTTRSSPLYFGIQVLRVFGDVIIMDVFSSPGFSSVWWPGCCDNRLHSRGSKFAHFSCNVFIPLKGDTRWFFWKMRTLQPAGCPEAHNVALDQRITVVTSPP